MHAYSILLRRLSSHLPNLPKCVIAYLAIENANTMSGAIGFPRRKSDPQLNQMEPFSLTLVIMSALNEVSISEACMCDDELVFTKINSWATMSLW